jgi:hypothetical protein
VRITKHWVTSLPSQSSISPRCGQRATPTNRKPTPSSFTNVKQQHGKPAVQSQTAGTVPVTMRTFHSHHASIFLLYTKSLTHPNPPLVTLNFKYIDPVSTLKWQTTSSLTQSAGCGLRSVLGLSLPHLSRLAWHDSLNKLSTCGRYRPPPCRLSSAVTCAGGVATVPCCSSKAQHSMQTTRQ